MQKLDYEAIAKVGEEKFSNSIKILLDNNILMPKNFGRHDPKVLQKISTPFHHDSLSRWWRVKQKPAKGLRIGQTVAEWEGEVWHHVSFSRSDRLPTYPEVVWVRQYFFRDTETAIQVFPPSDRHINIHPFTLHLWCNLQREVLPKFDVLGAI